MNWLRYQYARWKLRKAFREIDAQIALAKARHKPSRYLEKRKQDMLLAALKGKKP